MKKNALKIVAAIIGAAGVYLVYKYIKGNKKASEVEKKPSYIISVPEPQKINQQQFNIGTDKYPLAKGSKGYNVGLLQQALLGLTIDNDFGSKTEAALVAQTGKKSVASQTEVLTIASKNGMGYKMESNGKIVLIPKSQQNILNVDLSQKNKPLFGL